MRIKTKEEFIKDYGKDWVKIVGWNRYGEMDGLFGIKLPKEDEEFFEKNNGREDSWCTSIILGWNISRKMIVGSNKCFLLEENEQKIILDQNN